MGFLKLHVQDLPRQRPAAHVRILGVCVAVEGSKQQQLKLHVDDGTGVVLVQAELDAVSAMERKELTSGVLVDCFGRYKAPACLEATLIKIVEDQNAETLRSLEILQAKPTALSKRLPRATEISLMPIPLVEKQPIPTTSLKRKHPESSSSSAAVALQRTTPSLSAQPQRPSNAPVVVEKPGPRQLTASSPAAGQTQSVSVLPAAHYHFKVPMVDQRLFESGKKCLEIRLNVPPYSIIHANDNITINGKVPAIVAGVRKYTQLDTVLQMEPMEKLLPLLFTAQANVTNARASALRHFRQFFSANEEEQNGLVVFQLQLVRKPPAKVEKTAEEWGQLIYELLAKKRAEGCALSYFQFAFPALPVAQITDILTNLQMDGVVYMMESKYHLL